MSALDQGDSLHGPTTHVNTRDALFNRLAERHAQVKAAAEMRRHHDGQESIDSKGNKVSGKAFDFLPRFLQIKAEILADLDRAIEKRQQDALSIADLTKLLDETVVRVEDLQKWLNESSLYLTSFDTEQARLELKNLNAQFQAKREELLPSKKFTFSRKKNDKKVPSQTPTPIVTQTSPRGGTAAHNSLISTLTTFDERFSLTDLHDVPHLVLPKPGSNDALTDQSVYLANLTRCTVYVRGICGNLIARCLRECRVYTYPVAGSVWLEDCQQSDLIVACRQLRVHQTTDCRLGLHMASRPIIEHSTGLRVGPYPLNYPELEQDLACAGLSAQVNLWREVEDFSHPNKRLTTGSPNWSVLPEAEWNSLKPKDDRKE